MPPFFVKHIEITRKKDENRKTEYSIDKTSRDRERITFKRDEGEQNNKQIKQQSQLSDFFPGTLRFWGGVCSVGNFSLRGCIELRCPWEFRRRITGILLYCWNVRLSVSCGSSRLESWDRCFGPVIALQMDLVKFYRAWQFDSN